MLCDRSKVSGKAVGLPITQEFSCTTSGSGRSRAHPTGWWGAIARDAIEGGT